MQNKWFTFIKNKPHIHVVGVKNQGKTTVTRELVRIFSQKGYRVLAIKHSSHDHPVDKPGSDSDLFRRAGASMSIFQSLDGIGLYLSPENETLFMIALNAILDHIDLIIIESFNQTVGPKILVARDEIPDSLPEGIIATISQEEIISGIPHFPAVGEKLVEFLKFSIGF